MKAIPAISATAARNMIGDMAAAHAPLANCARMAGLNLKAVRRPEISIIVAKAMILTSYGDLSFVEAPALRAS
jgi:hypothetical protein